MTIDQFIDQLSVTRVGEWRLTYHNRIRANAATLGQTCPVCAVDGVQGLAFIKSAQRLELSIEDATAIVDAADGVGNDNDALRTRLLQATGLVQEGA